MDIHSYHKNDYAKHPLLSRLLPLFDIPEHLYIKGHLPDVSVDHLGRMTPRILTVVGSRKNTSYGREVIEALLADVQHEPIIILSGLALGIDSIAHREALKNNLLTIAIPGSGLSEKVIYPREHTTLAKQIIEAKGCLLSELSPETPAMKWTFLSRNRIMATLSDAVLVVEAKEKSGTLVTVRHALELGKNIGVVPGSIFSSSCAGSHALLRDGATPIMNGDDIRDLLSLPKKEEVMSPATLPLLAGDEQILFELLQNPLSKSALLEESKLSPQAFLIALTSLEMNGYIKTSLHEVRKVV